MLVAFFCLYSFIVALLNGTTYQNNSIVTLGDIGEGDNALLCITNLTTCCRTSDTENVGGLGNWYLPNGSRVPSVRNQWEFFRTRGEMVVLMHCRRGGEEGIYCCEIPDAMSSFFFMTITSAQVNRNSYIKLVSI